MAPWRHLSQLLNFELIISAAYMSLRAFFAKQSPVSSKFTAYFRLGDCFVGKGTLFATTLKTENNSLKINSLSAQQQTFGTFFMR